MGAAWDLDWSYDLLHSLVSQIKAEYRLELLGDAQRAFASGVRTAFVRHDVDMCLSRAREMALVEQEWGLRSTYHVMWCSPYYDPAGAGERADLAEIARAGHEIGLHFAPHNAADPAALEATIDAECKRLEDVLGAPVRSLSFHVPPPRMMNGPLLVGGRVNAYAAELLGWYLSDSRGRWREGDPRESLKQPRSNVLQVLVHPIWWGRTSMRPEDRLGRFVAEIAESTGRTFDEVSDSAWDHIILRAKKPG